MTTVTDATTDNPALTDTRPVCSDCWHYVPATEPYGPRDWLNLCRNCRTQRMNVRDGTVNIRSPRRTPPLEEPYRGRRYDQRRPLLTCHGCETPLAPWEHPNVTAHRHHIDSPKAPRNPPFCTTCLRAGQETRP